jgi:hypothetical protein
MNQTNAIAAKPFPGKDPHNHSGYGCTTCTLYAGYPGAAVKWLKNIALFRSEWRLRFRYQLLLLFKILQKPP